MSKVNFTYTITKNETIGIDIVLIFGGEDAMFSTWGHWENMLHMLLIFFFGVHVPEYYGCVVTVSLYKNIIIINKGFCLKPMISISTEPIEFFFLGKIHIAPANVLDNSIFRGVKSQEA